MAAASWRLQAVTSSPADGSTLFVLAVGTAISVALFKSLPFDALKDFAPISTVAHFDMLLLTKSSSPIRTLDDLLADARKRGEGMNLGTTLAGSSQFLAGALFRSVADIKATQVPFRTTPDVLLALLRGDIDVAVESDGALKSAIDDGQVRPIVSSGTARSLPEVPTAAERGLPRFEVVGWNALFAPAGHAARSYCAAQPGGGRGRGDAGGARAHESARRAGSRQHPRSARQASQGRHRQVEDGRRAGRYRKTVDAISPPVASWPALAS